MTLTLSELKRLDSTPPWDWPEDVAPALLEILRDRSAGEPERMLATELAGNAVVINDDVVDALLTALRCDDESENVRSRAAISLGPVLELCDTEGFDDPDAVWISERTFRKIQTAMRARFFDAVVPKEVRRRVLEASARAPLEWHSGAIRSAYASDDEEWKLTAVFCMQYVAGFNEQILESLDSKNPDIHVEAVLAAGTWAIGAAWSHVVRLVSAQSIEKRLLLAAISAVGGIRPQEAPEVLDHLAESDDPDVAEAVLEATSMNDGEWDEDDEDSDEDDDEDDEDDEK
jgi:hypothetical protein